MKAPLRILTNLDRAALAAYCGAYALWAEATEAIQKYGTMIKVAGDPWSGYSTFRNEPRLASALAQDDLGIEYNDDEKL